jgi:ATP-binding protein involved in chromosome partitioning
MRRFRTYHEVPHATDSGILEQVLEQRSRLQRRLEGVRTVAAVVSGKGGVGKSALTANLAAALALRGARVGALDADLNGPSLGRMLAVARAPLSEDEYGVQPALGAFGVRVMSMDLMLGAADAPLRWKGPSGDSFIWRGTAEAGALREFLSDVTWGLLEWLLIDLPPGTDRIERLLDLVPRPDIVLLVATPSEIARFVVGKSARLLREAGVPRVAIVANMTSYVDDVGASHPLFSAGSVDLLAEEAGLPVWGDIPFEPALAALTDAGKPIVSVLPEARASRAIAALADRLESAVLESP